MLFKKSFNELHSPEIATLANKYDIDPKIMELLFARGLNTTEKLNKYFHPELKDLNDPNLFENMESIKALVMKHIKNNSRILVFGDYDADGVCATTIMIKLLERLGAKPYHFLPNRYDDGYGLTMETAKKVVQEFAPQLIITVDCGIGSIDEVEYIKSLGIDIIVTDHHEVGEKLPDCLILNAKASSTYPFKQLCGAGVALKLAQAFNQDLDELLPIAMIATIADIVDLLDENRIIVVQGLRRTTKLPIGAKLLLQSNDIPLTKIKADKIAFKIAPKLNASGRMGSAETSLQLMLCDNETRAKELISQITEFNTQRQAICNDVYNKVKAYLDTKNIYDLKSIVVADRDFNVGILGIVSARIAEEFNRPTILFGGNDGILVGSGRSVNGVNIHEMLAEMADILDKFGGHTMAAGVSIQEKNFDEFSRRCEAYVRKNFENIELVPTRIYDFELSETDITDDFVKSMEKMEPCGHNNARPQILMKVTNATVVPMKNHLEHLMIKYKDFTLLAYNSIDYYFVLKDNTSCSVLVEIGYDSYKNKTFISGTVKAIDYKDVYRPNDENILFANYLKQLTYNYGGKVDFVNYNREQLIRNLLQMRDDVHGTLIVCNDYNSYLNFKTIYDSRNIIQNRIFELLDQSGLNTILLSPINFNFFNTFNKIIFLDPVLNIGYLSELAKHTHATIFLPHKNAINSSVFSNIKTDRETFGVYYKIFSEIAKQKECKTELYELFISAKQNNPKINYLQFMACLYVFEDLGIVTVNEHNGISFKINKNVRTLLDKSEVYKRYLQFSAK